MEHELGREGPDEDACSRVPPRSRDRRRHRRGRLRGDGQRGLWVVIVLLRGIHLRGIQLLVGCVRHAIDGGREGVLDHPVEDEPAPGTYTFQISNEGKFAHNLTVSGPAVSAAAAPDIAPGQSGQLTVTLMKGSYELWCSIDGHKDLGMDIHLAVG